MTWIRDHWFVLLLFTLYTAMMTHHAVAGKRRTRGMADYYVGGRAMGGIALGLSFFATYSSTNSFVGFSGQAYSYGVAWLLLTPVAVVFCLIAWLWTAPRLRYFTASLDSVTVPDFIGLRFGSDSARVFAAGIVLFASFLYMTAVFKRIGNLLQVFLEIPYGIAIIVVLVIVVLYTAVGGFISVVRTDAVQGIVMIIAAVLLFAGTVHAAGGLGSFGTVKAQPAGAALFAFVTALIALEPPGRIVDLTVFSGSLYAACFLPAIVLGLHWHRGNGVAVLASFVTGIATLVLWKYVPFGQGVHQVFPAMLLSTVTYLVVALNARPNEEHAVSRLFAERIMA